VFRGLTFEPLLRANKEELINMFKDLTSDKIFEFILANLNNYLFQGQ